MRLNLLLSLLFGLLAATATAADQASPAAAADTAAPAATAPAPAGGAAGAAPSAEFQSLDHDVQSLKQQVLELNRDLFVLQEDLLFPANTQVAVFLSVDVGTFFNLDTVKLTIDGSEVASYLYTPREVSALLKGGVQRFYIGNLKVGTHELVAVFTGKGPHDRDYREGKSIKLEKGIGARYVEFKISDLQRRQQPEFQVRVWE